MRTSPADNPICYVQPKRLAVSAWVEHVPFGMYLIDLLRPVSIVELGTRNGVSYCGFCQAVLHLGLAAQCVAVDTWHGDGHTGVYGPGVLEELRIHHDSLYGTFSKLHQGLFDEAAAGFEYGSIDLLHVDGFHTYEAASHDFETWLPRLSNRGVVMFHDVTEHGRDFGVWKLWSELEARYPSFTFHHGHGLGVLGVGAELPAAVTELLHASQEEASQIRRFFHRQGRLVAMRLTADLALNTPARLVASTIRFARKLSADSPAGG